MSNSLRVNNQSNYTHYSAPQISFWKAKIIDKKIQKKCFNCFQQLAHLVLTCFSKDYRNYYSIRKQEIQGISLNANKRDKFLLNWMNDPVDTSMKTVSIGDHPGADLNWKTPSILVFGEYDRCDGYPSGGGKFPRLEKHGKNSKANYLSNFYLSPIVVDGRKYKSVEHFYQASKFKLDSTIYKQIVASKTPDKARNIASENKNSSDLVVDLGDDLALASIMKKGLVAKFIKSDGTPSKLGEKLLQTGSQPLIEGNRRIGKSGGNNSDRRWGAEFDFRNYPEITLTGQSLLGTLLMELRANL